MRADQLNGREKKWLFWSCFVALMATSFGFAIRAMLITEWGETFHLSNTQMGEIMGAGLWPFALTIVLFSLIIDRIGYGRSVTIAFGCHIVSALITVLANDFRMLYLGTFIFALGNGIIEASINPVVATLYKGNKAKWLNILHAGWPAGMVISGIIAMSFGDASWRLKAGIIVLPMLLYGALMVRRKFPIQERLEAGIPFKAMLEEVGFLGALIIIALMVFEVGNFFHASLAMKLIITGSLTGIYAIYIRTPGNLLFVFLLVLMLPLATTELGTDSWIVNLMASDLANMGLRAGWILVYTALVMMLFRFAAGSMLRVLSPLGLLMLSAALSAIALVTLSLVTGVLIFVVATVYGCAKASFWPTMIGIAGERFPKGGALTLNLITGVGMIAAGIVGTVFLGFIQDVQIERTTAGYDMENQTSLHSRYITQEKESIFGTYFALDQEKLEEADTEIRSTMSKIQLRAQKQALAKVAILPAFMLLCYLGLYIYFKKRGGYRPVKLRNDTGSAG